MRTRSDDQFGGIESVTRCQYRLGQTGSVEVQPPVGAVVPFLDDEPTAPAEDRVWRHDCRERQHGLAAQGFALDRQDATLVIDQEKAFPSHLVHQGLDLGALKFNDLLLPSVDPAGVVSGSRTAMGSYGLAGIF